MLKVYTLRVGSYPCPQISDQGEISPQAIVFSQGGSLLYQNSLRDYTMMVCSSPCPEISDQGESDWCLSLAACGQGKAGAFQEWENLRDQTLRIGSQLCNIYQIRVTVTSVYHCQSLSPYAIVCGQSWSLPGWNNLRNSTPWVSSQLCPQITDQSERLVFVTVSHFHLKLLFAGKARRDSTLRLGSQPYPQILD